MERVTRLYDATLRIFEMAKQKNQPTNEVADDMARQKIATGRSSKK
jgi:leucine dehydrogenase